MASINNSTDHRYLFNGQHDQPFGIGIIHPAYQQKDLPNPCTNRYCSHMCTLTAKDQDHGQVFASCLCPSNYEFKNGSNSECVPVAPLQALLHPKNVTHAHWCLDAFISACEADKACENRGKCRVIQNEHGEPVGGQCECQADFGGKYCEVKMDKDQGTTSSSKQGSSDGWWPALLIFLTFVILTCGLMILLCRYGKYRQKFRSLRWSPSVIFRKTVMVARRGTDFEQRQRIISTNEDGSRSNLGKAESFANPVYEEVQVPIHQAYTVFKREDSTMSHDSDADSGFEINASNGSP